MSLSNEAECRGGQQQLPECNSGSPRFHCRNYCTPRVAPPASPASIGPESSCRARAKREREHSPEQAAFPRPRRALGPACWLAGLRASTQIKLLLSCNMCTYGGPTARLPFCRPEPIRQRTLGRRGCTTEPRTPRNVRLPGGVAYLASSPVRPTRRGTVVDQDDGIERYDGPHSAGTAGPSF